MPNFEQNLLHSAAEGADRPALRMDDAVLTYGQFRDAALRVAASLRERGVEPGDRVGFALPNVLAFPVAFYGALLAAAAVVPMSPLPKARVAAYKKPRHLWLVDALPEGPTGKILRRAVEVPEQVGKR